jgi:hypothetical protein
MNDGLPQDLSAAFDGIITMMLRAIRARGWRSLKEMPAIWREVMEFRRMGQALVDLMTDFLAGKLPPPSPAPEPAPWSDPVEWEALCAQPPAQRPPAARPEPAPRDRRHVAERPSASAADAACSAAALPHARDRDVVRPWPSRRVPDPIGVVGLRAVMIATGRSTRTLPLRPGSNCDHIVTYS